MEKVPQSSFIEETMLKRETELLHLSCNFTLSCTE